MNLCRVGFPRPTLHYSSFITIRWETIKIKIKKFGNLSSKQIENIENRLNIILPDDYKNFLLNSNGGVFEQDESNKFHINGIDVDIYPDVMFGLDQDNALNILYWNEQYKDDLLENTVIIGVDLMQGFIVLICSGEDKGVYYWDDSYNLSTSNDESNVYYMTDSFNDLIKQLN